MLVMESKKELLASLASVSGVYRDAREARLQAVADARALELSASRIAAAAGVHRTAMYGVFRTIDKHGVKPARGVNEADVLARVEAAYSEVASSLEERNRLLLAAYDAGVGTTELGKVTGMTQAGTSSTIRGLRGEG